MTASPRAALLVVVLIKLTCFTFAHMIFQESMDHFVNECAQVHSTEKSARDALKHFRIEGLRNYLGSSRKVQIFRFQESRANSDVLFYCIYAAIVESVYHHVRKRDKHVTHLDCQRRVYFVFSELTTSHVLL